MVRVRLGIGLLDSQIAQLACRLRHLWISGTIRPTIVTVYQLKINVLHIGSRGALNLHRLDIF